MNTLKVRLIQADLLWENPVTNRQLLAVQIASRSAPVDVIILPEMFTTGFSMNAASYAEAPDGPTSQWMQAIAKEYQAAVTGSVIIKENDCFYNRLLWVEPDGSIQHYNKRHLFTLAGEEKVYTAGQQHLLVEYKGWRILPLVCYDLRFPVWSRNNCDYDLLLYVANFPEKRAHAWRTLLLARAIENQSYTIGLNRVGTDHHQIYYSGDSCLVDYAGRYQQILPPRPIVIDVELDKEKQQDFRKKLAFLPDQDQFQWQ
ncbi:MAG: amidohydrolase [Bacteroidota bacterium]